jgi:organic radical activating enzyme
MTEANLVEIFSSFQGEGPLVGTSTLFVRFGECDLRCRWCDSPGTWKPAAVCRVDAPDGLREIPNPLVLEDVVAACERFDVPRHRFVSVTGGEPLLQPEAVAALAKALRARGPRVLLETHGLLEAALARVVDTIDVVSMDWKLASEVRRAGRSTRDARESFHEAHARFLETARRAPEVCIKVVVAPSTEDTELDAMAEHVAAIDPAVPVILQPVTPFGPVDAAPDPQRVLAWQARLERRLRDVRVIPQTHKQVGVA